MTCADNSMKFNEWLAVISQDYLLFIKLYKLIAVTIHFSKFEIKNIILRIMIIILHICTILIIKANNSLFLTKM